MKESKINLRIHPLDIFFLLRPPMLIPVWTFFLAGYWRSKDLSIDSIIPFIKETILLGSHFWLSFVSYSLLLGAVYIVNQIVDRESDRLNNKLFLIPLGIISVKLAYTISGILVIVAFSIVITYGLIFLSFIFLSLVLGLLYSVSPFRFKGRPIIDIFSNAIGYGVLAFGIGWLTTSIFSWKLFLYAVPYFFATASIFSISTILDIEGDREDGAITSAVRFGKKNILRISIITLLLSFIFALILKDILIITTSLVSLPLILFVFVKKKDRFLTVYMRGGSYILIVLVSILFPWFFILLIFLYLISKFYYKFRFGIDYPSLLEKEEGEK